MFFTLAIYCTMFGSYWILVAREFWPLAMVATVIIDVLYLGYSLNQIW